MTYESHLIRQKDELTKMSQGVEQYGAEEHWNFGLGASAWSVEAIGGRESLANRALYL